MPWPYRSDNVAPLALAQPSAEIDIQAGRIVVVDIEVAADTGSVVADIEVAADTGSVMVDIGAGMDTACMKSIVR